MPFRLYRSLDEARANFPPSVLTIGNFDGVHVGHRAILGRVVAIGREHGWKPSVLTFDPHPTKIVAPARAPRLLTTLEQRCALFAGAGIEQVLALPFTAEIARLTPEEFVSSILDRALGACAVLVGDNFRFGHRQAGDTARLSELGREHGFFVEIVPAISLRGRIASSSEIRRLIGDGNVSLACRLLQRPYALEGDVVPGHGVGSRQTVPTLNLKTQAEVLPLRGVYITRTADLDSQRQWPSISNVGYRPTFGGDDELSIETFLLAPLEGPTPGCIKLEFLRRIREERKFESPEALKIQILHDVARAQTYFRRLEAL
ncbi:MAG TPA: bifunctional riboflavin kinase/FAD synthetase [Bryobacteraceae bacterium]|nr:bifunctional riboflavin kinase/FAD synthetase [Bryobacteraceae bacterium]